MTVLLDLAPLAIVAALVVWLLRDELRALRKPKPAEAVVVGAVVHGTLSEARAAGMQSVHVGPRVALAAELGLVEVEELHGMNRAQRRALERSLKGTGRKAA